MNRARYWIPEWMWSGFLSGEIRRLIYPPPREHTPLPGRSTPEHFTGATLAEMSDGAIVDVTGRAE
jgi:hypothetical protein